MNIDLTRPDQILRILTTRDPYLCSELFIKGHFGENDHLLDHKKAKTHHEVKCLKIFFNHKNIINYIIKIVRLVI